MVGDIQKLKNPNISTEEVHEEAVQLAKLVCFLSFITLVHTAIHQYVFGISSATYINCNVIGYTATLY